MDFEEDTYSLIFSALKHPIRRKILNMLNEAPATYTQILNKLKIETGLLNYHLENLKGLITKNENDQYFISEFGEAALTLIGKVEAPIKKRSTELSVFGFKINPAYILLVIITVSIFSNVYLVYTSQTLTKERTNAFAEVLIQTRGFLDESINILNVTARESKIEFALWNVLFDDLIQLSRQYKLMIALDTPHRPQWSQIKTATDSLLEFVGALAQKYAKNNTYLDITYEHSQHFDKIIDCLLNIKLNAFSTIIVIGSDPKVNINDREITEAMETSIQLQTNLEAVRRAFNL